MRRQAGRQDFCRTVLQDAHPHPAHEGHRRGSRGRRHIPAALFGFGLTTGLFWLVIGLTGTIDHVAKLAAKPVVRGIMLGLGMSFVVEGIHRMVESPVLAGVALTTTIILLSNPRIPAMFVLLLIGVGPPSSAIRP